MHGKHSAHLHLFLIRCKRCTAPLSVAVISPEGNLERIHGHMLAAAQPNPCGHKPGYLKMPS